MPGVVDLLLHAQDRSYTVPQLFELLDDADLRLERFYDPPVYEPRNYAQHPDVVRAVSTLAERERATIAELLHGRMAKHIFFATHTSYTPRHVEPKGLPLLTLRPRRSPLFDWTPLTDTQGARPATLVVREHRFDFQYRSLSSTAWTRPSSIIATAPEPP